MDLPPRTNAKAVTQATLAATSPTNKAPIASIGTSDMGSTIRSPARSSSSADTLVGGESGQTSSSLSEKAKGKRPIKDVSRLQPSSQRPHPQRSILKRAETSPPEVPTDQAAETTLSTPERNQRARFVSSDQLPEEAIVDDDDDDDERPEISVPALVPPESLIVDTGARAAAEAAKRHRRGVRTASNAATKTKSSAQSRRPPPTSSPAPPPSPVQPRTQRKQGSRGAPNRRGPPSARPNPPAPAQADQTLAVNQSAPLGQKRMQPAAPLIPQNRTVGFHVAGNLPSIDEVSAPRTASPASRKPQSPRQTPPAPVPASPDRKHLQHLADDGMPADLRFPELALGWGERPRPVPLPSVLSTLPKAMQGPWSALAPGPVAPKGTSSTSEPPFDTGDKPLNGTKKRPPSTTTRSTWNNTSLPESQRVIDWPPWYSPCAPGPIRMLMSDPPPTTILTMTRAGGDPGPTPTTSSLASSTTSTTTAGAQTGDNSRRSQEPSDVATTLDSGRRRHFEAELPREPPRRLSSATVAGGTRDTGSADRPRLPRAHGYRPPMPSLCGSPTHPGSGGFARAFGTYGDGGRRRAPGTPLQSSLTHSFPTRSHPKDEASTETFGEREGNSTDEETEAPESLRLEMNIMMTGVRMGLKDRRNLFRRAHGLPLLPILCIVVVQGRAPINGLRSAPAVEMLSPVQGEGLLDAQSLPPPPDPWSYPPLVRLAEAGRFRPKDRDYFAAPRDSDDMREMLDAADRGQGPLSPDHDRDPLRPEWLPARLRDNFLTRKIGDDDEQQRAADRGKLLLIQGNLACLLDTDRRRRGERAIHEMPSAAEVIHVAQAEAQARASARRISDLAATTARRRESNSGITDSDDASTDEDVASHADPAAGQQTGAPLLPEMIAVKALTREAIQQISISPPRVPLWERLQPYAILPSWK